MFAALCHGKTDIPEKGDCLKTSQPAQILLCLIEARISPPPFNWLGLKKYLFPLLPSHAFCLGGSLAIIQDTLKV